MEEVKEFINDMNAWSIRTFGGGFNPIPALHYLAEEVQEVIDAIESQDVYESSEAIKMEFANCFILLTQAAIKHGISFDVMFEYAKKKMEINKSRKWGKPDANGVCKHID